MSMLNRLMFNDRAPKLMVRSLDFNAKKTNITAANIANADTPNYKAKHVEFESVLRRAAGGQTMKMATTNEKHISPQNMDFKSLQPNLEVSRDPARLDGNNVNLEKEMANLAEAKINYNAGITALMKRGGIVKAAITETR